MSRGLIAVGAGITGCIGTLTLACRSGNLRDLPSIISVMGLTTGLLALATTKICKDKSKALDKKDYILVVGASFIGSAAGGAAVVALATMISGMVMSSMMGPYLGNMLLKPFYTFPSSMTRITIYQ